MPDGRIDTQGPIQDLGAQGILQNMTLNAAVDVKKEALKEAMVAAAGDLEVLDGDLKKPRKLVKVRRCPRGGVELL